MGIGQVFSNYIGFFFPVCIIPSMLHIRTATTDVTQLYDWQRSKIHTKKKNLQLDTETYFKTDISRTHKTERFYYNEFMAKIWQTFRYLRLGFNGRYLGWPWRVGGVIFLRFRDHTETTPQLCRLMETSVILYCFSGDNLGIVPVFSRTGVPTAARDDFHVYEKLIN